MPRRINQTKHDTFNVSHVMDNGMENPWGYGNDILRVQDAGVRLGLISPPPSIQASP